MSNVLARLFLFSVFLLVLPFSTDQFAGAAAISVLVDERFGGTWDDLHAARAATAAPG